MSDKPEIGSGAPTGNGTAYGAGEEPTGVNDVGIHEEAQPVSPSQGAEPGEPQPGKPANHLTSRLTGVPIVLIAMLGVVTVLLTWRTKALEKLIADRTPVTTMVEKPAPEFRLSSLSGENVSLADYQGKKVVVSFWASWCGPCKIEMPELREFYRKYHKADSKFEILAISIDDSRSDAERYASHEQLPFPVLLDSDQKVAESYQVEGIPTMFVVDQDGKVTYANQGLDETMQFRLMRELDIKFPGSGEKETRQE